MLPELQIEGKETFELTPGQERLRLSLLRYLRVLGLGAMGFNNLLILKMIKMNLVTRLQDIYLLKPEDFAKIPKVGRIKGKELYYSLHDAKQTTLAKFISALGIPGVGITKSRALVKKFSTLGTLMNADRRDLENALYFSEACINKLLEYFGDEENIDLIWDLREHGVCWPTPQINN